MPTFEKFNLPDAGEGLTEAEIVHWHVAVGDAVTVNQTIVEIETAWSLGERPSPAARGLQAAGPGGADHPAAVTTPASTSSTRNGDSARGRDPVCHQDAVRYSSRRARVKAT